MDGTSKLTSAPRSCPGRLAQARWLQAQPCSPSQWEPPALFLGSLQRALWEGSGGFPNYLRLGWRLGRVDNVGELPWRCRSLRGQFPRVRNQCGQVRALCGEVATQR